MIISLVNLASLEDEEVLRVLRAINRQVDDDFARYWGHSALVRLEGAVSAKANREHPPELRGDAIVFLLDEADVSDALGYHNQNYSGLPCGFVFTEVSKQLGEPWSVTLSHEVLELIADANVNKLAAGPHPADANRTVFHWYEMCDAVQAETYQIDEVSVSNFVLPLYFTPGEQVGARNDFLGRRHNSVSLRSFGVNPGGYVGYFNPQTGQHETYSPPGDTESLRRMSVKGGLEAARRAVRYANLSQLALDTSLMNTVREQRLTPARLAEESGSPEPES